MCRLYANTTPSLNIWEFFIFIRVLEPIPLGYQDNYSYIATSYWVSGSSGRQFCLTEQVGKRIKLEEQISVLKKWLAVLKETYRDSRREETKQVEQEWGEKWSHMTGKGIVQELEEHRWDTCTCWELGLDYGKENFSKFLLIVMRCNSLCADSARP